MVSSCAKENSFISVEKLHNERNNKRDRKRRTNISIFMRPKINSQLEKSRFNIIFFPFTEGGRDGAGAFWGFLSYSDTKGD